MRIALGQIYIDPKASFPFSYRMQVWLGEQLSALAVPSHGFSSKYGSEFGLTIRLSAKTGIRAIELAGPTVFKNDRDVEYTVFLPYDIVMRAKDSREAAAAYLVAGVRAVFEEAGLSIDQLAGQSQAIIEHLRSNDEMIETSWLAT